MRKFMVVAIAGAALGILGGSGAQADEHNPCAPQPKEKLKRCEQQDNCRVAGAAPFEDHHLSKADRVRFYRHCVWLEERYRLAQAEAEALRSGHGAQALALRTRRFFVRRVPKERIRYVLGTLRARALRR